VDNAAKNQPEDGGAFDFHILQDYGFGIYGVFM
jgi:hypothetical protein